MPYGKRHPSLKSELSKLSKLSNVQGGLPPIMRGLPVLAILAGEVVSKATTGSNLIERHMLGADEAVLLGAPLTEAPAATIEMKGEVARDGVRAMCRRCRNGEKRIMDFTDNRWLSAEELGSMYLKSGERGNKLNGRYFVMYGSDRHP